ncbi:MAG: bifunctional (p)ppGpp synthetase/guanosine-3',5'-bis(diphosphate) 3'-pyrophosphohydrolase [Deltaproteobacteria bacterium]|nr:bifunctional (p)ppGpp synthetase/guanosine-3',5'-bis(diphosphate) 3'-pyrophosphohydrolase [Deltaproteobacteria bacterium]
MIRLNDILEEVQNNIASPNLDLIKRAYVFSAKAHAGQIRMSGEPYLAHPLAVSHILAKMRMDELTVATGLMHDTVEDNKDITIDQLARIFGSECGALVDGVTKIGQMTFSSREHQQAENFKKILIATSKDIRVILIKLADRLHNMRTLEHMPVEKRRRISQETLDIYAPLAHRLGIQWVRNELEDLAFRFINPKAYYDIVYQLSKDRKERDKFVREVIEVLRALVAEHGIEADVKGRQKNVHSIFRKMVAQAIEFDQVYDLIAFRIIVETVAECYETLGYIHARWKPVPGRFKDYIALPKNNMYQSLHTTVIGPQGQRMEVQIRTSDMNRIAEEGVAAHWQYKEGLPAQMDDAQKFNWLRKLVESYQDETPREYLNMVKTDLFTEEIYVFTPRGDVMSLPAGATPIDFAYRIHTQIGHTCVGARINGKIVPLAHRLVSGDRVEIVTRKDHGPSRDWLKVVKTNTARAKIRDWLRKEEMERSVELGKTLAEKELRKHKISLSRVEKSGKLVEAATRLGYSDVNKMLANLGFGKLSAVTFVKQFVEDSEAADLQEGTIEKILRPLQKKKGGIKIQGIDDVLFSLAKCCHPLPGEEVKGYVTRGRGIRIHSIDCLELEGADPDRLVDVEWDLSKDVGPFSANLDVDSIDEPMILSNVSKVIGGHGVNISEVRSSRGSNGHAVIHFEVLVKKLEELDTLTREIMKIRGVTQVTRVRG